MKYGNLGGVGDVEQESLEVSSLYRSGDVDGEIWRCSDGDCGRCRSGCVCDGGVGECVRVRICLCNGVVKGNDGAGLCARSTIELVVLNLSFFWVNVVCGEEWLCCDLE